MKYSLTLFLSMILSISLAQEKLNKIQAPTSPAASILGLQPTAVLIPKSYQALETALYSNFIGENGGALIPNDFSLEFTPYWAKNHALTVDEYLYPKSVTDQIIRNSSFSIASTQNYQLNDSTVSSGLAFGYRNTIYFGNKKDREKVQEYLSGLNYKQRISALIGAVATELIINEKVANQSEFLANIKETVLKAINTYASNLSTEEKSILINEIMKEAALLSFDINSPDAFLDQFYNLIDSKLGSKQTFEKFKNYIKNRQGWSVDLAYAGFVNFPTNNFSFSYVPRQSFWITPTYLFKDDLNFFKIMGVVRYEWYNFDFYKRYFAESKIYENNFDYGLAVAFEFEKFSIKLEAVGRNSETEIPSGTDAQGNELFRRDESSDFQCLGSFNYNLSDQIILSYNIGNRFEPILNSESTLVSVLTLNLGFGTPTEKTLKLTD
ncbi:hypothetical protein ABWH96_00830 [Marivirga tractuosa]|uniref:hypothetical protein n=1 Tax=Marivirga tractuosa TaxID=1006 RepID=UPI0035D117DA